MDRRLTLPRLAGGAALLTRPRLRGAPQPRGAGEDMWGSIGGRDRVLTRAAACALAVLALVAMSELPASAALSQPAVVSDNPSDVTPHIVLDNSSYSVYDFAH